MSQTSLSWSGRMAGMFQSHALTPLLAIVLILLGLFAIWITPREEEPQINVTMVNVMIPFPGASSDTVQRVVARPAEQMLSQIVGVEHTFSVAQPGMALLTVQYKVGVTRTEALVRLNEALDANRARWPADLGVMTPIVKPQGIDDVPVFALTLWTEESLGADTLERIAHGVETELQRVPGTRTISTIGGPGRAVFVQLDPTRMRERGVDLRRLIQTLRSANTALVSGEVIDDSSTSSQRMVIETGEFFKSIEDVGLLVVGTQQGQAIYLRDIATLEDRPPSPHRYVWHSPGIASDTPSASSHSGSVWPAVTITVTKKNGMNAVALTQTLQERIDALKNTVIPADVHVTISRDYGTTAGDKAQKLIQKLIFATGSVIILVGIALGRREAVIVGVAVILTLLATLFASWAWGFTLNRVSLFALIFSIGILVDDAIVVVENIHRHQRLSPEKSLREIIPLAVHEVGGPTTLATLTVMAALLPMAFVTGLMGPYMSPIPINASLGMALSLLIAFSITPWLALKLMKQHAASHGDSTHIQPSRWRSAMGSVLSKLLEKARYRWFLLLGIGVALLLSIGLVLVQWVVLKMLPFDNKSELQLVVDMPTGTPVEDTAAALQALSAFVTRQPEVRHVQGYAGTAAPITFNGLVRQYDLRQAEEQGDLQINLVDKKHRHQQSHEIALKWRPELQKIAKQYGAKLKIVEVPPGPPVLSPIVLEVYGPDEMHRRELAGRLEQALNRSPDMTGVDSTLTTPAPRTFLKIRQQRATMLGISSQDVVTAVRAALSGIDATFLHDGQSSTSVPVRIEFPAESKIGLQTLLQLPLQSSSGSMVPLSELVDVERGQLDTPLYTKDNLSLQYVMADMAGPSDSPLYGLFGLRSEISKAQLDNAGPLGEYWIRQPTDPYRELAIKWDGEWQITFETFRDMGAAYLVGLILIYLLGVAQFKSYMTPLIIMAPIPLTMIGVMPGHALLGAQFTATSMIGMIALAGIIVRNSILLVDFIELQVNQGIDLKTAVVQSALVRAQPIVLTGLAAMMGAFFILDDPIFNGLAVSLIFGILVSTLLTLVVIPVFYYAVYSRQHSPLTH